MKAKAGLAREVVPKGCFNSISTEENIQGHVLIVDDEADFRFGAGIALRRAGYRVTEAADGKEALALLSKDEPGFRFDLLLMDVQMPGLSGVELIDEMKRKGISTPVFGVSGYADRALVEELCRKGCAAFMDKPFEPDELVEKIWHLLGREKKDA